MLKIVSGHIKIYLPVHHEIIFERKLEVLYFHMLAAWIKHQMVVDINIQDFFHAKNPAVCTKLPIYSKLNFSE